MTDSKNMTDDIDLDNRIEKWSEPEQFLTRQVLKIQHDIGLLPCRNGGCPLPRRQTIRSSMSGGITGAIIAIIIGVANYFTGGNK